MPALPGSSQSSLPQSVNQTGFQAVCAWPVSGQYGPGARALYYVLVAACIFARKAEWLRTVCLAATLLLPAVAAIHGVVLAAVHKNGAVDLDVYGAFQLCSIGALAAPGAARLSETYFQNQGRNAIYVWSAIVLAGLISLTVEFYRASPSTCLSSHDGTPISPHNFVYGESDCGFICSVERGPFSPIRGGSGNNINAVPAPGLFTFNAATLISAACCIPAILLLIGMWIRIVETNKADIHQVEASEKKKSMIARIQKTLETVIFGGAILAILVAGEINFFSRPIRFDTEPMANVGQWAPIAGTVFAILGSAYLVLAKAINQELEAKLHITPDADHQSTHNSISSQGTRTPEPTSPHPPHEKEEETGVANEIARKWIRVRDRIATSDSSPPDISLRQTEFYEYPDVPGEQFNNPKLTQTQDSYRESHRPSGSDDGALHLTRSRTGSFRSNRLSSEANVTTPTEASMKRTDSLQVPAPGNDYRR